MKEEIRITFDDLAWLCVRGVGIRRNHRHGLGSVGYKLPEKLNVYKRRAL